MVEAGWGAQGKAGKAGGGGGGGGREAGRRQQRQRGAAEATYNRTEGTEQYRCVVPPAQLMLLCSQCLSRSRAAC